MVFVQLYRYNDRNVVSDLPATSKLPLQDDLSSNIACANKEEVTVDSVEISGEEVVEKILSLKEDRLDSNNNYHYGFNENRQKSTLKIDNHDIGEYFTGLSEVTVSKEAQNKFSQTLLILDALHIGLNDLEYVVTESSELHQVLKSQKETLVNVIAEIQSGVSRSMEKVATSVLDKVQRLERNFEIQWCKLERAGHKDELKGLFYDCQENEEKYDNSYNYRSQLNEKSTKKNRFVKDNYEYEVDKDSRGKEYNRHVNSKEGDIYSDFVKNERYFKSKYDYENKKAANSRNPDSSDPHTKFRDSENYESENEQPNHDGNALNEERYKISNEHEHLVDDEKYENVDKQSNKGKNSFNKEKYKHLNEQKSIWKNGKYENVENQPNHGRNAFNKEQYKNENNQKFAKHDNSEGYNSKKSGEENIEKDRKHSKPKHTLSDSEKQDVPKKVFKNQRIEDVNYKLYDKSEHFENTKSKNQFFGNDENLEKFVHKRSENKYSENYKKSNKYEENVKFETSKDHKSYKEKFSNGFNEKDNKFGKPYYQIKDSEKELNDKNPSTDESTYQERDHNKKLESNNNFIKATAEKLGKFLKEKCDKNKQKPTDLYNKLKEGVKEKMKVPVELFNSMFSKYCSRNKNNERKQEYKKEQSKGDRNFLDRTMNLNDEMKTDYENANIKNIVDPKLMDSKIENGSPFRNKDENVVELSDKLSQWTFVYESPPNNESNIEGDWFIKAGESRSKARW